MVTDRRGAACSVFNQKVTKLIWRLLADALGDDLNIIKSEVDKGRSLLTTWGNEFFVVLREEKTDQGRELVIVAAAGKNSKPHLHSIYEQAKLNGFASIRVHTLRPEAMLRMSRAWGFKRCETIIKAVL
ncbi:hypothetical protein [Shewanella violacea]|uniref:Uncharacterized protein n=1 Tax=Shewanella violacea (strain JCM 10179 / CIP 106290 / LMG 19151 / DSS12) TaxID=637905 RepID=D4ZKF7_SHEVD|nr:hypothetical protein [Shewanella violacea]BAJ02156.1 hypothetical protein SVI_2185 [Shewanella violacea DSS12]